MTTMNRSPEVKVRNAIMRQLERDPQVDATDIAVLAKSGSVTLTGYVNSYAGKLAAERAATHVRGVRAIANKIEVRPKVERVDTDIATDVARALSLWNVPTSIKASVHDGYVTLTGNAKWLTPRRDFERAIRRIRGVRRILNKVILTEAVRSPLQPKSAEHVVADASVIARGGNQTADAPESVDEIC